MQPAGLEEEMGPPRLSWAVTATFQDLLPWTVCTNGPDCSLSPNPCPVPCDFVVCSHNGDTSLFLHPLTGWTRTNTTWQKRHRANPILGCQRPWTSILVLLPSSIGVQRPCQARSLVQQEDGADPSHLPIPAKAMLSEPPYTCEQVPLRLEEPPSQAQPESAGLPSQPLKAWRQSAHFCGTPLRFCGCLSGSIIRARDSRYT